MSKISLDLFSGAGGLSCGLEMAGFMPILANEIDPIYAATYAHNHPSAEMVVGDIREFSIHALEQTLRLPVGSASARKNHVMVLSLEK